MSILQDYKFAATLFWRLLLISLVSLLMLTYIVFVWSGFGFFSLALALLITKANLFVVVLLVPLGPLSVFFLASWVSSSILTEANLVRVHGERSCLWVNVEDVSTIRNPALFVMRSMVWKGHDSSGEWLSYAIQAFSMPSELQEIFGDGIATAGSILWARSVLACERLLNGHQSILISLVSWVVAYRSIRRRLWRIASLSFWFWFGLVFVLWHADPSIMLGVVYEVCIFPFKVSVWINDGSFGLFFEWLSWRLVSILTPFLGWVVALNTEMERHHSYALSKGGKKLIAHFKQFSMQAAIIVNDLGLPSYVRRKFQPLYTPEALAASKDLMASLGWPINVDLSEPDLETASSFKEWVLCGTDFKQGIHHCKLFIDQDLKHISGAMEYRRSEEYSNTHNELVATSRYFKHADYDFPDLDLDDVWLVVKDIFANSRLTSFNYIISKWEKKYALGSFMRDPDNPLRKYSRKKFISNLGGYAPFKALWARTFYWATHILPVSAVSVKGEALPERKWLNDKVRTVVGSPIAQYILSTVWNYGPNHKFSWESTPIKVGMPLNGYWMSTIWARHSRCQVHIEGDFEAFDSTISGKVISLIAAIRKKGYENHKDRDKIAALIDVNYEQVSNQLLNTTSTGNIYLKGTGLTTGHSSTSADNSLGLVILYLMAWRDLTGLSAKEFLHYNELSCFGDDHVLSMLAIKPAVWTPKNIKSTMARWGLVNNLDVKKNLDEVTFLSKHGRKSTRAERLELEKFGVKDIFFFVWHDKDKLVGKLTAKTKSMVATYRVKRLISYLSLTAHHPDVYEGIAKVLLESKAMLAVMKNNKISVPSYSKVLSDWYSPSPGQVPKNDLDEEVEEAYNSSRLIEYGATNAFDSIFGAMSMIPDLLSPLLFNFGYNKAFQIFLKPHIAWIVDFVCMSNSVSSLGVLSMMLKRTPYRWIDASIHVPGSTDCNYTDMLVRHWLFLIYCQFRPVAKYGAWLNFIISRLGSFQFILNGHLFFEQRQNEFQLDYVLVAAILNLIVFPFNLRVFQSIILPDLQLFVDLVSHFFLVTIWSSVPPNFRETSNSLMNINPSRGPLAISAPTGTGKSTAFIQHVYNVVGHKYRKIIVIEPRTNLVIGLADYMESQFGLDVSGSTTGLDLDRSKKVYYMTSQSLLGMTDLLSPENLFILDEAHLDEPFYQVTRTVLNKLVLPRIFISATLTEPVIRSSDKLIEIPIAQIWSVSTVMHLLKVEPTLSSSIVCSQVREAALEFANHLSPGTRALIFLPRKSDVEFCADSCLYDAVPIHSGIGVPDDWANNIYFSTSVCDVGITIPGIDTVWSTNIADVIDGHFVQTSKSIFEQRRGRTGRTNNGIFHFTEVSCAFHAISRSDFSAQGLKAMINDGLPVELACMVDRNAVLSSFGFESSALSSEQVEQACRGLSVFYRNFQPVFRGLAAASQSKSLAFGRPVVLHPTGAGHISSSFPQAVSGGGMSKETSTAIHELAAEVVDCGLRGLPPPLSSDNYLALKSISGPVFAVSNLVQALVSDLWEGETSLLNPKNRVPTGSMKDVYEVGKIMSILNSLKE